jgi:hypothetical protein
MIRKGTTQSEIYKETGISRQAVSKAIKSFERDLTVKLLEFAQSLGILVEWYSVSYGVLVGIQPQLDNLLVLLIIDNHGDMKVYYDQDKREDGQKEKMKFLNLIKEALNQDVPANASFEQIVNHIRGRKKNE